MSIPAQLYASVIAMTAKEEFDDEDFRIVTCARLLDHIADEGRPSWKKLFHWLKTDDRFSENYDEIMEQLGEFVAEYNVEGSN